MSRRLKSLALGERVPQLDYNEIVERMNAQPYENRGRESIQPALYGQHQSGTNVPAYSLLQVTTGLSGPAEAPVVMVVEPTSRSPIGLFTNGPYSGTKFPLFPLSYGAPFKVKAPTGAAPTIGGQCGPETGSFEARFGVVNKGLVALSTGFSYGSGLTYIWAALAYVQPSAVGTKHARTGSGGVPPKVGLQMGGALGKEMTCNSTGLLAVTTTDIMLYNPSTGPIAANADVVYSINDAGVAVIVVEDCALGNCADSLPVVTSTGPYTRASGVAAAPIILSATGTVLNWVVTGTLPPGMVKSGTGGVGSITGTPSTPGTYVVTAIASNCAGSASVSITITIT